LTLGPSVFTADTGDDATGAATGGGGGGGGVVIAANDDKAMVERNMVC